jgi:hypothetical protein
MAITAIFYYDTVNKLIMFFTLYTILYPSTLLMGPLDLRLDIMVRMDLCVTFYA